MLKKMVFERLNSGGVKLGSQETRNAVYGGPLNDLCLELSENAKFRRMWGIPLEPLPEGLELEEETDDLPGDASSEATPAGVRMYRSMEDVELVLRFFAYRQIGSFKAGLNRISELLDKFITRGNSFPASGLMEYRALFEATVHFLWEVLETDAFTTLGTSRSKRPTKIVYDPLMFVASSPEVSPHHSALMSRKEVLRSELTTMYEQHGALFSGRRTNHSDTLSRNDCVREAFGAAIAKISP
jgi:hypothetical protein